MKAACQSLGGARSCQAIAFCSHLSSEVGTGTFWSPVYFLASGAVWEQSWVPCSMAHGSPRMGAVALLDPGPTFALGPQVKPQPLAPTCPAVLLPRAFPLRSTGCLAPVLYTRVTQPRSVKCLCTLPGFPCSRLCPQAQARFVPGSLPRKQLPPAWRGGGSSQLSPLLGPAGGGREGSVSQHRSPGRAAPAVCRQQRVEGADPRLPSQLAHLPLAGGEGPGGERSHCVCFAGRQRCCRAKALPADMGFGTSRRQ